MDVTEVAEPIAPETGEALPEASPEAATPAVEEKTADPRISEVLARSARLDKQAREMAKREKEYTAKLKEYEERETRLKSSPLEALKHYGHTYEGVTERVLEENTPEARIRQLQEQLETREKQVQEQLAAIQQQTAQRAQYELKQQIHSTIKGDADRFELLNLAPNSVENVYAEMQRHYAETQEILPFDKAAEVVEGRLLDEVNAYLEVASKAKKVSESARARFAPQAPSPQDAATQAKPPPDARASKASPTITNGKAAPSAVAPARKPIDLEESKQRAAQWLEQQLRAQAAQRTA